MKTNKKRLIPNWLCFIQTRLKFYSSGFRRKPESKNGNGFSLPSLCSLNLRVGWGGRGFIVQGVSSGDPRNWEREYESFRIVPLFLFQNCENGMCTRNVDCALCSTFQGKSLKECKQSGKCEENVLEVQIVDDIKKKTGKNGLSQTFFFFYPSFCQE